MTKSMVQGLPVNATTVRLLLRVMTAQHALIMSQNKCVEADNMFALDRAKANCQPVRRRYIEVGLELQREYDKWSTKTGFVPAEASNSPNQSEEERPPRDCSTGEVIDAEFDLE